MNSNQRGGNANSEIVILLHGLARRGRSMAKLSRYLQRQGYETIIVDYPSTKATIQELSSVIPDTLEKINRDHTNIHFVSHSMGGILLRFFLAENRIPQLGKIVMLSPPNHGSEVVDHLKSYTFFNMLNGPAGQQLGTDRESIPNLLGKANFPLGIITGNRTIDWHLLPFFHGPSDGKVSVESAKLEGMRDFLVVPHSHTFIMRAPLVLEQTGFFLKNGFFKKINPASIPG